MWKVHFLRPRRLDVLIHGSDRAGVVKDDRKTDNSRWDLDVDNMAEIELSRARRSKYETFPRHVQPSGDGTATHLQFY